MISEDDIFLFCFCFFWLITQAEQAAKSIKGLLNSLASIIEDNSETVACWLQG